MKFHICLIMLFGTVSAFCSDMDLIGKRHSWSEPPEEGQLYMILASEYGFDRDCQGTFIFQKWGCEDPYLCHQRGWFEANQEMFMHLIRGGARVVFLPNGKADLPYLNLECQYLHTLPEVDEILDTLDKH